MGHRLGYCDRSNEVIEFDCNRNWGVSGAAKQVACSLLRVQLDRLSDHHDAAIGERALHDEREGLFVPTRAYQPG
jgi:hypothetical protein